MKAKKMIQSAQRALVEQLGAFEGSIAALYDTYAGLFPAEAEFWRMLASEERVHEMFMRGMGWLLDRGCHFYNLAGFNAQAIQTLAAELEGEADAARRRDPAVTLSHALAVAFFIEKSIVDGRFYHVAKSNASEFAIIADHLVKDSRRHLKRVSSRYVAVQRRRNLDARHERLLSGTRVHVEAGPRAPGAGGDAGARLRVG